MLHKVSDLPMKAREVVEALVGRPLAESETVSVRPLRLQKEGADARVAGEVANRLEQYFAEIDRQHPAGTAAEDEEALDEAMRAVRPGYTPYR